jgi:hypothetical protein
MGHCGEKLGRKNDIIKHLVHDESRLQQFKVKKITAFTLWKNPIVGQRKYNKGNIRQKIDRNSLPIGYYPAQDKSVNRD